MRKTKSGGLKTYYAKKFDKYRSQGFWTGAPFWIAVGVLIGLILKK